jgi:hypothetical protein
MITGVVDDSLDPKRPTTLEVGLHPGVPEEGVEGHLIATAQQPGAVAPEGWGDDPPPEDDLHLLRSADVKVVGAQRLKEPPGMARCVEHDGARDLNLTHRDVPPVARGPVGLGQR